MEHIKNWESVNMKPMYENNDDMKVKFLGTVFNRDSDLVDLYLIEDERMLPGMIVRYGNHITECESFDMFELLRENFIGSATLELAKHFYSMQLKQLITA